MTRLVAGFGVNDSGYVVRRYKSSMVAGKQQQVLIWSCRIYAMWSNMIKRCYGSSNNPSYTKCDVAEDWVSFSSFKAWVESQGFTSESLLDMSLDKDIKFLGNRRYSPQTCLIVPRQINSLAVDDEGICRGLPSGVYLDTSRKKKYEVKVSNNVIGKRVVVGRFENLQDAEMARLIYKRSIVGEYCETYGAGDNVRCFLHERYTAKLALVKNEGV